MAKYTVLVVDDDPLYLHAISHIILSFSEDIVTISASSAIEAIDVVKKNNPDLIIIDWEMPEMNGIDFIKRVKNCRDLSDIPVIVCTGKMTDSGNVKTAFDAGAVDFIRKPIDKVELNSRVHSMLKLSESYQTIKKQKEELIHEKEKSDLLLQNILPKKIAEKLKESGYAEPELFENVTVFFSDLVGFTKIASKMKPQMLINELNEIFTGFDLIMEQNNCERIKTIGDGYIAVCGMPEDNPNHAKNIMKSAIQINKFLEKRNRNNLQKWKIRTGIHSGRVVGGIVGIKKYIYDVFGDTINLASRLESHAEPMQIVLSKETYDKISSDFVLSEGKSIQVKGKGEIVVYIYPATS